MLKLPSDTRIFMAVTPVDMRRSFSGLCAIIAETLGANPLGGDLFLFRGKRSDRVKAMIWDRTGLAIWYKRLERGKYKWPSPDAEAIELTEHELALLLDGADFTRIRRLPPFVLYAPPLPSAGARCGC
jgi:transposase